MNGRFIINIVGTIRSDRTGADIKPTCDGMTKHTYKTAVWQHSNIPLYVAAWDDNAVVKTSSNFHSLVVIAEGVHRRDWMKMARG